MGNLLLSLLNPMMFWGVHVDERNRHRTFSFGIDLNDISNYLKASALRNGWRSSSISQGRICSIAGFYASSLCLLRTTTHQFFVMLSPWERETISAPFLLFLNFQITFFLHLWEIELNHIQEEF